MKLQRLKDETYLVRQNNKIIGELFSQPLFYSDKSIKTSQSQTWNLLDKCGDIIEFESFNVARAELKAMYPDMLKSRKRSDTLIDSDIAKRAWEIRKDSAKRLNVKVNVIPWRDCLKIARQEKAGTTSRRNYQTDKWHLPKLDDIKKIFRLEPEIIINESTDKATTRYSMASKQADRQASRQAGKQASIPAYLHTCLLSQRDTLTLEEKPFKPTAPQRLQISDAQYNAALWGGTDTDTVLKYWYDNRKSFKQHIDKMCEERKHR